MVVDRIRGALGSYYESEMERWEETKRLGPVGTFKRDFQFGLTGPAPTIREGGEIDRGPAGLEAANEAGESAAVTALGAIGLDLEPMGNQLGSEDDGGWKWLVVIVVGVILLLVLSVASPYVGLLEGVLVDE